MQATVVPPVPDLIRELKMKTTRYFSAPWSKTLIWISASCTILCIATTIPLGKMMFPFAPASFSSIIILLTATLPILVAPFAITGYTINGNKLFIHRLGWRNIIDMSSALSVIHDENALVGSWRLCGNGGFFSFTGWFYSKFLGVYRAFFTDPKRSVVIVFPNRKIVVSPNHSEQFVEIVQQITQS